MFLSDACANRVMKTQIPDMTVSGMGLMELNTNMLKLFDRITRNMAPIVEMNPDEVYLAIPTALTPLLTDKAKELAKKAVEDFTASGKQIVKGAPADFPLDDLLSRLREKYTTVMINGTSVVAMAAVMEYCEGQLLQISGTYAKDNRRGQVGRNDIRWAIQNDNDMNTIFD